jgi:hypothetical protein
MSFVNNLIASSTASTTKINEFNFTCDYKEPIILPKSVSLSRCVITNTLLTFRPNQLSLFIGPANSSNFYEYDSKGHLIKVLNISTSVDDDFTSKITEEHLYLYDTKGHASKMLRIKNQLDTTTVLFTSDEKGNIIDEKDLGKNGKHYYYYYDAKNRLTDVVKYNSLRDKLLPDLLFEYNSASQITQMITTEEGISNNYYVWKKIYNDGLRIIEKCFTKENELLGYFEFEYN